MRIEVIKRVPVPGVQYAYTEYRVNGEDVQSKDGAAVLTAMDKLVSDHARPTLKHMYTNGVEDNGNGHAKQPARSAGRPPASPTGPAPSKTGPRQMAEFGATKTAKWADGAPVQCPTCGGEMWDNRKEKKNPKAPDLKCKDRDNCDGLWWKVADMYADDAKSMAEMLTERTAPEPEPISAGRPDRSADVEIDDDIPF